MFWLTLLCANILIVNLTLLFSRKLFFFEVYPDLILVFAVYVALFGHRKRAIEASWLSGLIKDLAFGGFLGINTLLFTWSGYVILKCRDNIFRDHPVTHFFLNLIIIFFVSLINSLLENGLSHMTILVSRAFRISLVSAAMAPFLYIILKRIPLPMAVPRKIKYSY